MTDPRSYPDRPFLAVSAAIFRDGKVLLVQRARPPATDVWTLPGGVVELGETLIEAVIREVAEETSLAIEPVALAGYRNVVMRDDDGKVQRHFVVLPFAARWLTGEFTPSDELADSRWEEPGVIASLKTTAGLAEVIAQAARLIAQTTVAEGLAATAP